MTDTGKYIKKKVAVGSHRTLETFRRMLDERHSKVFRRKQMLGESGKRSKKDRKMTALDTGNNMPNEIMTITINWGGEMMDNMVAVSWVAKPRSKLRSMVLNRLVVKDHVVWGSGDRTSYHVLKGISGTLRPRQQQLSNSYYLRLPYRQIEYQNRKVASWLTPKCLEYIQINFEMQLTYETITGIQDYSQKSTVWHCR